MKKGKLTLTGKVLVAVGGSLSILSLLAAPEFVFLPEAWATDFFFVLGAALFVAATSGAGLGLFFYGLSKKVPQQSGDVGTAEAAA